MVREYDLFTSVIDDDVAIVTAIENGNVYFSLLSDNTPMQHSMGIEDFDLIFEGDDSLYNQMIQNQLLIFPVETFVSNNELGSIGV